MFGVLPVILVAAFVGVNWGKTTLLFDFKGDLYRAGQEIARGHSPYDPSFLAKKVSRARVGEPVKTDIDLPVYPAPTLVAAVPFTWLSYRAAVVVFTALSILAVLAAFRVLGVGDWRCYGVAFLSWPLLHGLLLGALTPFLIFGVAIVWRFRDHLWPPAIALSAIVVAKIFLWPIGVWLLVTRRLRALAAAALITIIVLLAGWAIIGFAGLAEYPKMLRNLTDLEASVGVSVVRALLTTGLGTTLATLIATALAGLLIAAGWIASRDGREQRSFEIAVVACLVASPIVWPHYLALLFVPIAMLSKRLSAIWLVPLLTWIAPVAQTHGRLWAAIPYLAVGAIVAYEAFRDVQPGTTLILARAPGSRSH